MEASYLLAGASFIVGGGIGVITGGLFAHGKHVSFRDIAGAEMHFLRQCIDKLQGQVDRLTNRNREYALAESKRQEQRIAAAAKGRETQAAKRAAEKAKTDALHESMRAEHRELAELVG